MGANPMQKMKRNSILTGLIIGLLIGLILCVFVYVFLTKSSNMSLVNNENSIKVNVVNKEIKSGSKITVADVTEMVVSKDSVPTDAVALSAGIETVAKIDLAAGTVLGASMLSTSGETLTSDMREQEYNMITLPTNLVTGDFIDIRLQLPNGGDYIVISKKQVLNCNSSTIWLKMNEEEILTMSNAIIEYYIMTGSKLYATIYTEPGSQEASTPTYCPNSEVEALIKNYKNTDQGIFSEALINIRNNNINPAVREYSDSALGNVEQKIQEEIKSLQESREAYFGALNSAY